MYLKERQSGDLVEVLDTSALIDPCMDMVKGRYHAGEEMQEFGPFPKQGLVFPSDEPLPECWVNPDYRASRH